MTAVVEAPLLQAPARVSAPARRWLVLTVLAVAQLMLVVDATVVNIALPRAQAALGFSDGDRQWVVTAYSLAFGALLLAGGRLADRFGRRRVFLVGLVGFAVASAIGGMAGNFAVLVSARALQGGFGALLAPSALALLTTTFSDSADRARAFGAFGAVSAAGGSAGLLIGGTLTQYASWRWVMYVNVVLAAAAALAAVPLLPRDRVANRPVAHSLVPLRIVDRNRGGAIAAMFLSATGVFGVLLFLTYYLESTLGYPPTKTGLAFLPMAAVMVVVGGAGSAAAVSRFGHRRTIAAGLVAAGVGMAMLTRVSAEPRYATAVLPATLVMGLGLGLVFAPCFDLGTAGVDEELVGTASAMLHVAQQIGGSIGMVMLNVIATTVSASSQASVHSYAVVFWVCALTFGLAALVVTSVVPADRAQRPVKFGWRRSRKAAAPSA